MKTKMDGLGRIVVPKSLRDSLGLTAGSELDISRYGDGLHIVAGGRTARLVDRNGATVAESDLIVTDEMVFDLIDAGRR